MKRTVDFTYIEPPMYTPEQMAFIRNWATWVASQVKVLEDIESRTGPLNTFLQKKNRRGRK